MGDSNFKYFANVLVITSNRSKKHVYGDVIGKGHFGVVCHLQHQVDKREYAVKIILNDK